MEERQINNQVNNQVASESEGHSFLNEPGVRRIVARFVKSLADRSDSLSQAKSSNNVEALAQIAHQLKGSAGSYGFHSIGTAAAALEKEALTLEADLASINDRVEDLITLCQRATTR